MQALMKFLGGLQAGSEVLLPPGDYVLGGDDACDLVLADVAVKSRHALLRIKDDAWEIEPLDDAEVRVEGGIISGPAPLGPYQVVSLGGSHFTLGPEGAWDRLPAIPQPVRENSPVDDPHPSNPGAPPDGEAEKSGPKPERKESAGNGQSGETASGRPKRRGWPWLALFLIAATGLAGYHRYYGTPGNPDGRLADRVGERLAAMGIAATRNTDGAPPAGTVAVDSAGSGRVRLSGLLATEAERRQAIAATGLPPEKIDDELISVANEVGAFAGELRARAPNLKIAVSGNGYSAMLSGVADTASEIDAVIRSARDRLDPRIGIRRRLWVWRELTREAEREAGRLGMPGARFIKENGGVRLESDTPLSPAFLRDLADALTNNLGDDAAAFLAPAVLAYEAPRPAEPEPEPEPEPEAPVVDDEVPSPVEEPEEPDGPDSEDVEDVQPEEAEPQPVRPLAEFWRIADIYRGGFRDHMGKMWRIGDTLKGGLRVVDVWRNGVVFRRNGETLFVQRGAVLFERDDSDAQPE